MAKVFTDDLREDIQLEAVPQRIVSLCPSVTETLVKLGLKEELAGRTSYCYRPVGEIEDVEKIGGPKELDFQAIETAKPDLIFAVKEENDRNQIQKLRENYPVFVFDVNTYAEALDMIIRIGEMTEKQEKAVELSDQIDKAFAQIPQLEVPRTFLYLVWKDPLMAAGKRTFINSVLSSHGFINCMDPFIQRYVTLNIEVFKKLKFEVAFLPSEPMEFNEEDKKDILAFFPEADVRLVDGESFSWFGYRMLHAAEYLTKLIGDFNQEPKKTK
ncbi:MAG: helical backbone metal receptor [Bacteroidales bacterium]|nr:helical backbone metal receptor [Bacteroidales bacterium]